MNMHKGTGLQHKINKGNAIILQDENIATKVTRHRDKCIWVIV